MRLACVAWRFWLGALSNKGGRGQRNREEIGAGATWKTACTDGGLFWVGTYASVRIVPIGSECSPVNQNILVISHGRVISAKQNQNIKEALTGASSILNIWRENSAIVLKPEQELAIYSLLQRRDVMEILSTSFGKSIIFTVFAMAKEEISSSKTCMITISPLKVLSTTRYLKCCRWAVQHWTLWQKQ